MSSELNILTCNCGSSSLKFKLVKMPEAAVLIEGEAERVGAKSRLKSRIVYSIGGETFSEEALLDSHIDAFKKITCIIENCGKRYPGLGFDVLAHRYVHPGDLFENTVRVSAMALVKLKDSLDLAPLHNPIIYNLILYCNAGFPDIPQYITFDTTFHKTIPGLFSVYPIEQDIAEKHKLKRTGFHGISHKYVMQEGCRFLERDEHTQKIISCHLGTGGSSICAILQGKSINNSMGFTPLEGLLMNTRSGNMDIGAILYIMFRENMSAEEAEKLLNRKSGIGGLYDESSDLRELIEEMNTDETAAYIVRMYVSRVKKYIGHYSIILQRPDMLVFTDTIGTESAAVREMICGSMGCFGIELDRNKNLDYSGGCADISSQASQARILIVPTDEEMMIARETYSVAV